MAARAADRDERLRAAVARAVDAAPPLSDRTIARLSVLLGPTSTTDISGEQPAA